MTQAEARRRVEASTDFVIRDGRVWLREVAWLRAVEEIRREALVVGTAATSSFSNVTPIR